MPTYEYYCPENGQTVEVMHGMTTTLDTWSEVCDKAEIESGSTTPQAPVEKLLGTGMLAAPSKPGPITASDAPAGGCCGGMCKGH